MPKDDTLRPEDIALIKDRIDHGAEWPDELGDPPAITPDPAAVGMIEAIGRADDRAFTKLLRDRRDAVNGHGGGGSTPLLYAARCGDAKAVDRELTNDGVRHSVGRCLANQHSPKRSRP